MRRTGVILAVTVLAITVGPAAAAGPHLDVTIIVPATLDPGIDPFEASGPAQVAGLICATGISTNEDGVVAGRNGKFLRLRILKRFTCLDGTLDINLLVHLDLTTGNTTANWNVVGGTGAYANVKGRGTLVGTPMGSYIEDVYTGQLH